MDENEYLSNMESSQRPLTATLLAGAGTSQSEQKFGTLKSVSRKNLKTRVSVKKKLKIRVSVKKKLKIRVSVKKKSKSGSDSRKNSKSRSLSRKMVDILCSPHTPRH